MSHDSTEVKTSAAGTVLRGIALVTAFWVLTADYLHVYFSSDDLMNLYRSVGAGWGSARGLALFWSSHFYRPLGGVLYLSLYSLFGMHAGPYKLAMLLILTANVLLAWRAAALLLENAGLGALAALLVLYHASVKDDVWYNFGNFATIYDIVCFTFLCAALCMWLQIRRAGRFPGAPAIVLLAALHLLALDAKEVAAALPLLLLLYECFFGRLISRTKPRLEWRSLPAIAVLALMTAVYVAGKSQGGDLVNNPDYAATFNLHTYLGNMSSFLNQLFYTTHVFRSGVTTWFLAGGLVLAAVLRGRVMAFGWFWFLITLLPVAFINPRYGSVLYVPSFGLAVAFVDLAARIYRIAAGRISARWFSYLNPARAPALVVAMGLLLPLSWHEKRIGDAAGRLMAVRNAAFGLELQRLGSARAASVLFLGDPFDTDRYDPQFLASLLRKDPALRVGRAKTNQLLLSPAATAQYQEVYGFDQGHLRRADGRDVAFADQLRARDGYADPLSGIYLTVEPELWARRDFGMQVHCPALQSSCRLTVALLLPSPPLLNTENRTVSIDIGAVHWRDMRLTAGAEPRSIEMLVPSQDGGTPVEFHLDRAIPASRLNGDTRELAVLLNSVHISP